MELTLRKYGNSTVLVFPPCLLRDLGLDAYKDSRRPDNTSTQTPSHAF